MIPPARPRVVSLFSGIGATELALADLGCETVAHSDIEPYALSVFGRRFPHSIPLGSVTEIAEVPACEIMAGGFPCQDISNAGKRAGIGGERSGLWSEFARLIGLAQPKVVLIENVAALLARGLDVVLADLCELGYAAEWDCIPAAAVGAPHLRDRVWIVAYHEDEDVVREDRLERSLATLALPPVKWPRAGRMCQGGVYVRQPLAPRRTKRLNPGSAWVGVRLDSRNGWWHERPLWPTTQATMADRGGRGDLLQAVRGNTSPSGHFSMPVFPTPSAVNYGTNQGGAAGRVGPVRHSLESMARHGMWPTPRTTDANGAGRHGDGGPEIRTAVMERELYLTPTSAPWCDGGGGGEPQAEVNRHQENEGKPRGALNATWVEWLQGFPLGWTDLACDVPRWHGWNHEPRDIPRVTDQREHRRERLTCLGNAQVPQVMRWWAAPAVERLA